MRGGNITTAVGIYNAARLLLAEFSKCEAGSEETVKALRRSLIIPFAVGGSLHLSSRRTLTGCPSQSFA